MPRKRKSVDPEIPPSGHPEILPVNDSESATEVRPPIANVLPGDSTEPLLVQNGGVTDRLHPKYPHLENLARYDEVLRCKRVVVQEKLDGANVRFGLTPDGEFWLGSRNQLLDPEDFQASYGFVGWAADHEIASRLLRTRAHGLTFYGEWVGKKVQGRITYRTEGFYLFDVREGDQFLGQGELDHWARQLNLSTVPRRYWGPPDINTLTRFRDLPLAGNVTEGIVIKADPPQRDERGDWVMAKYKSPDFEEVAKAKRKVRTPRDPSATEAAQVFVDQYVTLERLRHVFAQVREEGADPSDVRSTGLVLKAMHADIVREGLRDYQQLDQDNQRAVGKLQVPATKALIDQLVAVEQQEAA